MKPGRPAEVDLEHGVAPAGEELDPAIEPGAGAHSWPTVGKDHQRPRRLSPARHGEIAWNAGTVAGGVIKSLRFGQGVAIYLRALPPHRAEGAGLRVIDADRAGIAIRNESQKELPAGRVESGAGYACLDREPSHHCQHFAEVPVGGLPTYGFIGAGRGKDLATGRVRDDLVDIDPAKKIGGDFFPCAGRQLDALYAGQVAIPVGQDHDLGAPGGRPQQARVVRGFCPEDHGVVFIPEVEDFLGPAIGPAQSGDGRASIVPCPGDDPVAVDACQFGPVAGTQFHPVEIGKRDGALGEP